MSNQYQVAFNEEAYKLYEDLKAKGLTSQPFPEFVKDAFYDKVDDIRAKRMVNKVMELVTDDEGK